MNRKKSIVSLVLAIIFLLSGITFSQSREAYADNNPASWILCPSEAGEKLYNANATDVIPYYVRSKSNIIQVPKDSVKDNNYNGIMSAAGFEFGTKNGNPFERFGFAGTNFSSYAGEWKYVNVNACVDDPQVVSSDYGQFYEDRYEPQASFKQVKQSKDPRSLQLSQGLSVIIGRAIRDSFATMAFGITKYMTAFTTAMIGLSFSDVSEAVGFGAETQKNIFNILYNSIYTPFVIFMILATAMYIAYQGMVKRQIRLAIGQLIKVILTFVITIAIVAQPTLLALPSKIANAGQAMVISALASTSVDANNLCGVSRSNLELKDNSPENAALSLKEYGDTAKNIIGCRLWADLVFRPWVKAQWNEDYEELSKDIGNTNGEWVGKPTVDLGNGKKVNNWALFQLSTQTDIHESLEGLPRPYINGVHPDWWRIVDATSNVNFEVLKEVMDNELSGGTEGSDGGRSGSVEKFIDEFGPGMAKLADQHNMYASIMIGQAILESGGGEFTAGTKYNFFGIKCTDRIRQKWGCGSVVTTTEEDSNGNKYQIQASFAEAPGGDPDQAGMLYIDFFVNQAAFKDAAWGMTKTRHPNYMSALVSLIRDVKYATDSSYVSSVSGLIKTYDLTRFDTPPNNSIPTLEQFSDHAGSGGSGSNNSSVDFGSTHSGKIVEIKTPVQPTKYWNYWVGNESGRFINALSSNFLTLAAVIPLFGLALINAVYSLGLNILMVFAPLFLLMGLWAGKGQSVMLSWLSSVATTIMKKIVTGFILVLSISVTTKLIQMLATYGYTKTIILLILFGYILNKNRGRLIQMMSKVNIPGASEMSFDGGRELEATKSTLNKAKAGATVAGGYMVVKTMGGIKAKKQGQKFREGSKIAGRAYVSDKIYSSNNRALRTTFASKSGQIKHSEKENLLCLSCGRMISTDETFYRDANNNVICMECGDMGYKSEELNLDRMDRDANDYCDFCGKKIPNNSKDVATVSGKKMCVECQVRFKDAPFDISNINPGNYEGYSEYADKLTPKKEKKERKSKLSSLNKDRIKTVSSEAKKEKKAMKTRKEISEELAKEYKAFKKGEIELSEEELKELKDLMIEYSVFNIGEHIKKEKAFHKSDENKDKKKKKSVSKRGEEDKQGGIQ